MLAWNGGGKSNFTDIIKEGGYKLTKNTESSVFEKGSDLKAELKHLLAEVEELIEKA